MNKIDLGAELLKIDGEKQEPKLDTWEIFTLADAYAEREPLQYLVAGLLTLPSLSIVYGAPSTLKSFLLADLIISVASGLPWIDREVIKSPGMWIDFDNGPRRTHERFAALGRARGLDDIPLFYVSMPNPWLCAGHLRDIESLIARINERGIKILCIDNLGLISTGTEENSAAMIAVMGNLRLLAERTGAAVVVIHHQKKVTGIGGRPGDSLRGHSSIEAALDLALLVEREDHSNLVTIKSTKTRDMEIFPFGAELRFTHKIGTHELDAAHFTACEVDDNLSDYAIEKAITDVLADSPLLKQAELIAKVKEQGIEAGKNRIGPIANRMAGRGRIEVSAGQRNVKLYSLPVT